VHGAAVGMKGDSGKGRWPRVSRHAQVEPPRANHAPPRLWPLAQLLLPLATGLQPACCGHSATSVPVYQLVKTHQVRRATPDDVESERIDELGKPLVNHAVGDEYERGTNALGPAKCASGRRLIMSAAEALPSVRSPPMSCQTHELTCTQPKSSMNGPLEVFKLDPRRCRRRCSR
jgi:hypothetical protein